MKCVISTKNWEEMLKALGTRHVAFVKTTENGFLYAAMKNGVMDPNPALVAKYVTK